MNHSHREASGQEKVSTFVWKDSDVQGTTDAMPKGADLYRTSADVYSGATISTAPQAHEQDYMDAGSGAHLNSASISAISLERNRSTEAPQSLTDTPTPSPKVSEQYKSPLGSSLNFTGRVSNSDLPTKPVKHASHVMSFAFLVVLAFFVLSVGSLVQQTGTLSEGPSTREQAGRDVPVGNRLKRRQLFTSAPSPSLVDSLRVNVNDFPSAAPASNVSTVDEGHNDSLHTEYDGPWSGHSVLPSTSPTMTTPAAYCAQEYPAPPPLPGKKGGAIIFAKEGQIGSWIENLPKLLLQKPYWNYNWGPIRIDAQPDDIEFVPMIWGGYNLDQVQEVLSYVVPLIESGLVKRLFGFNEPDLEEQSNMPLQLALDLWPALESTNVSLTSPSCAHPEREWMQGFMSNVTATCKQVDWVGVHWYKGPSFEGFIDDMATLYEMYRRPMVITEFAVADWDATTVANNSFNASVVLDFMKKVLPWLEAQDWIVGYVWFNFPITSPPGTSSALFDEQGNLTTLGQYYASVRTDTPQGDQSIGIVE